MNAVYYYYKHNCIGGGDASIFQYLTTRGDLLLLESVAWGSFSEAFYQRFCLSLSMVLVFGSGRYQASYFKILEVTLISEMPFLISELLLPKTERNLNSLLQLANTNSSCSNSTLRQWKPRLICQRTAWFSLQVLKSLLSACKAIGAGVMQSIWRWDVRQRTNTNLLFHLQVLISDKSTRCLGCFRNTRSGYSLLELPFPFAVLSPSHPVILLPYPISQLLRMKLRLSWSPSWAFLRSHQALCTNKCELWPKRPRTR